MRTFVLFATTFACVIASIVGSAVFQSGAYDNVVVAIKDSVSAENCKTIISNVEVSPKIYYDIFYLYTVDSIINSSTRSLLVYLPLSIFIT